MISGMYTEQSQKNPKKLRTVKSIKRSQDYQSGWGLKGAGLGIWPHLGKEIINPSHPFNHHTR